MLQSPLVTEAMVLSTCNRVEVYAVVEAFHGGLSVIGQVLSEHSGMSMGDLTKYAYVRYSEAAVEHLFSVTSGLDSAVVGEQQVLGQVRRAYAAAEANHTVGRTLHELAQRALSVGKRVHSETGIDAAGASVVSVALDMAGTRLSGLAGRTAAVIGAGSMGALSAAHLVRAGIGRVYVVNRSLPRAERLAANLHEQGVAATALGLDDLAIALADADIVVSSTGAVRPVVSLADVHHALTRRDERRASWSATWACRAMWTPRSRAARRLGRGHGPHPARAVGAGGLRRLRGGPSDRRHRGGHLPGRPAMAEVTPTVTALRQRAADVVEAELLRLDNRLPGLDSTHRDEVARTVRRVVDKLLHAPTVRVKQLASAPGGDTYAEALRELFELDPHAVDAVATAGELPLLATEFDVDAGENHE